MNANASDQAKLYRQANFLAIFTIIYNLAEGLISVLFGAADETLSLFGFGLDSFIEVVSAVGIWHMLQRIKTNKGNTRDEFETRALTITGTSFYVLAVGLAVTALIDIKMGYKPESTRWGIIISLVSIGFMWLIIHYKTKVGRALGSAAILADAACSRACLYLSLVLLIASSSFYLTGIDSLDALGAGLIAWLAFREGREAFQKAKGASCTCCCSSE